MRWALVELLLAVLVVPVIPALSEIIPSVRSRGGSRHPIPPDRPTGDDFTVLVPIYGHIRYLETVEFLRPYGRRVVLCTTSTESPEFDAALDEVAADTGFRIVRVDVHRPVPAPGARRSVAGTVRDQIIKAASQTVTTEFVICIDADTVTERPLGELVGALAAHQLDLASVRLVPSNTGSLLARLQGHEYRMAMRLRRVMPWLCSGACQVARTAVHQRIMRRHSLFFQGNDAEMGLLGDALGYRVGYLAFRVPTTVPERFHPWWRQRAAWAGGEFRLFIVNVKLVRRHPFFVFYGAVIVIAGAPLRWVTLRHPGLPLVTVLAVYWILVIAANWRDRDRALIVYPLYGLINSLILVPIGVYSYLRMARADHNYGVIRTGRPAADDPEVLEPVPV